MVWFVPGFGLVVRGLAARGSRVVNRRLVLCFPLEVFGEITGGGGGGRGKRGYLWVVFWTALLLFWIVYTCLRAVISTFDSDAYTNVVYF